PRGRGAGGEGAPVAHRLLRVTPPPLVMAGLAPAIRDASAATGGEHCSLMQGGIAGPRVEPEDDEGGIGGWRRCGFPSRAEGGKRRREQGKLGGSGVGNRQERAICPWRGQPRRTPARARP